MSQAPTSTPLREIPHKWLAKWRGKGIPQLLLEELALHFVLLPIPGLEIGVKIVFKSLPDPETFFIEASAKSTSQPNTIRSAKELYIKAKQQAEIGNKVCAAHPFLQLFKRGDTELTEGFRRAVESIVNYTPDCRPRRNKKLTQQQIDEVTTLWVNLFQEINPLVRDLLRAYCSGGTTSFGGKPTLKSSPSKKAAQGPKKRSSTKNETRRRITLLARAFIGSSQRARGLSWWLLNLYRRGSSERIRAVVDQAFRRWDGTEIERPTGGLKAAYIAAGLNDPKDPDEYLKMHIQGWKARKRGLPRHRTKLVGDG